MADDSCEEFHCVKKYKSSMISSTPIKNIDDEGYNNTSLISSNVLSNQSQSSKVICLNSTPADLQLSSNTYHFTSDNNRNKRKRTDVMNSNTIYTSISSINQDTSIQFNVFSDLRLKMCQLNGYSNTNTRQFFKSKNSVSHKNVYYKRINLEGQMKVDFMYYLAKRHNFVPATEKIFSFLYGKDIITMSMVSKIWHYTVKYSPTAKSKKQYYLLHKESVKENHECTGQKRSSLMSKTLADIGNITHYSSKHRRL